MSKVQAAALAAATTLAVALPTVSVASAGGLPARSCAAAREPAMLVRITGFKARTGTVRVQSYGGDPAHFFDKGSYLRRIDRPVPAQGPLEVCVPVAGPGDYAVSVRHDLNGSGKTDHADGGGMSGNPRLSLIDVMFKRRPDPDRVAVAVGRGVRVVPVTLNYLQGGRFEPVATARN